ncbi:MAG: GNAT family N-acetyltransferase [Planctomycetota bacterium]
MKSAADSRSLERALALMERCLRPAGAASLAAEFPLVFEERFSGRVVTYQEQGDVRSTCALLVRDLVIEQSRLRVGLIGSVATQPSWRGRGLASRVLEAAEHSLAREGCAIALLWADDPEFYAARGYRTIGWEIDFVLTFESLATIVSDATLRALAPDDVAAIHRLYSRHAARTDRSEAETAALLECPGMTTLVLQRDRDVAAYACLGRGGDFANTVHEWGGGEDDVIALIAEHARRLRPPDPRGSIAVIAPPGARRMRQRMEALGAQVHDGVLAMAKVLHGEALCELLDRFVGSLSVERDSHSRTGASVVARGPRGSRTLSNADLLALLFSPRGNRDAVADLERDLGVESPRLPLHPFLWGLDSI